MRGLARLVRLNPTDAERFVGLALTTDRLFAAQLKRKTPVGKHIPDFVSFTRRVAIEIMHPGETETVKRDRTARREWLTQRGYHVVELSSAQIENELETSLIAIESGLQNHSVNEA